MRVDDVTEEQAHTVRCPYCHAQPQRRCTTDVVSRRKIDAQLKRSHRKRRQAWLDRREARNDARGESRG